MVLRGRSSNVSTMWSYKRIAKAMQDVLDRSVPIPSGAAERIGFAIVPNDW
jgi:hypothetical protein